MANESRFGEFYQLETWRLAQIVLTESDAFAGEREQLVRHYGRESLDPQFIQFVPANIGRRFTSAIHLLVENRARDFNDKLYHLICVKFRWCERRNNPMVENAEIVASIADIFGAHGVAALTVFLIKRKFLDKLCNCKAEVKW